MRGVRMVTQARPTLVGPQDEEAVLKLGEGSWFAIPYRTILEVPRDLSCSSRSAFATGSGKRWVVRMKNTPADFKR